MYGHQLLLQIACDRCDYFLRNRHQALRREVQGGIPADLLPAVRGAAHGLCAAGPDPGGMSFSATALGQMWPREQRIGIVAANRQDFRAAHADFEAADGLA